MKRLRSQVGSAIRQLRVGCADALRNLRHVRGDQRLLIVRHHRHPGGYDVLLDWVELRFPSLRRLFELRQLPCAIRDWTPYRLHAPWLKDPVQRWSQTAYEQAMRLTSECDARGIPVINRVDRLVNAGKTSGATLIAAAGLRTPKIIRISDLGLFRETLCGLSLPLIVREDWGHGKHLYLARSMDDLGRIPFQQIERPVAVEFVDVLSAADGLYRKYRYLAVGDRGIPLHLHVTRGWITRGERCENSPELYREEEEFLSGPAPHHAEFQRARQAMGLDFVAFDFSYDRAGQPVVWEANPYPYLHYPRAGGNRTYRTPALERALAAMLCLYLDRARLPWPGGLDQNVGPGGVIQKPPVAELTATPVASPGL